MRFALGRRRKGAAKSVSVSSYVCSIGRGGSRASRTPCVVARPYALVRRQLRPAPLAR